MYKSSITVTELAEEVLQSVNCVPEIPGRVVARYLQELQQRLYVQVLRPLRQIGLTLLTKGDMKYFTMQAILPEDGEDSVCIDDLHTVLVQGERVFCADTERFYAMSVPVYTHMADQVYLRNVTANSVSVLYLARPAPITYTEEQGYGGSICMPNGYVSLLKAGLHAALCRHIGDDDGYHRYAAEYNDLLADLKKRYPSEGGADA